MDKRADLRHQPHSSFSCRRPTPSAGDARRRAIIAATGTREQQQQQALHFSEGFSNPAFLPHREDECKSVTTKATQRHCGQRVESISGEGEENVSEVLLKVGL
jgi:hypothetical protein